MVKINSKLLLCLVTYIRLCITILYFMYVFIAVVITRPPENTTVCRGSDVVISCGQNSTDPFDIIWGFNGSTLSPIPNNPMYWASNQTLIVLSINYTTTVQCAVHILPSNMILQSTTGTVTVVGMCKCIYEYIYQTI